MDFLLEITKIWQKSWDFWLAEFSLEIFKIHRLVWTFLWIFHFWLFWICCINVLFKVKLILNLTNCLIKDYLRRHIYIIGWCLVRPRNPYARPCGFQNLYPSKKNRDCDSTADKIYRFSPKLSLWLPSLDKESCYKSWMMFNMGPLWTGVLSYYNL